MADKRKLQGEIDRCLKQIHEHVDIFVDYYEKIKSASNPNQKEKFESELKRQIKKLQKFRDQLKTWLAGNDAKTMHDKLMENRRLIEVQMERYRDVEREAKTKAFSKEGLDRRARMDPAEREKAETREWLNSAIEQLEIQIDGFEAELETLQGNKRKKNTGRQETLEEMIEKHKFHCEKLENIIRCMDNDSLSVSDINEIKDGIEYYVSDNQDPDFYDDDTLYEPIDELISDEIGVGETTLFDREREKEEKERQEREEQERLEHEAKEKKKKEDAERKKKEAAAKAKQQQQQQQQQQLKAQQQAQKEKAKAAAAANKTQATGSKTPAQTAAPPPENKAINFAAAAGGAQTQATKPAAAPPPSAWKPPPTSPRVAVFNPSPPQSPAQTAQKKPAPQSSWAQPPQMAGAVSPGQQAQGHKQHVSSQQQQQQQHPGTAPSQSGRGSRPPPLQMSQSSMQDQTSPLISTPSSAGSVFATPGTSAVGPGGGHDSRFHSALNSLSPEAKPSFPGILAYPGMPPHTHTPQPVDEALLGASYRCFPSNVKRQTGPTFVPTEPADTPPYYPKAPPAQFDSEAIYGELDPQTLFLIFYYQQGTKQQYLAAKQLKKLSWRFHKKHLTWFQRHEEPKVVKDSHEEGSYIYFDYEKSWCQRKKDNFTFEYAFLEDHTLA